MLVNNIIELFCECRRIMTSIILLSSSSVGNVCDLKCADDALPMVCAQCSVSREWEMENAKCDV